MPKIDTTWFGAIVIDKKTYRDALIVGDEVIRRESQGEFSSHTINRWELSKLLEQKPEAIIIGCGYEKVLEVPKEIEKEIRQRNIDFIILETPDAIAKYNELSGKKRVNALIHVTC